ncbi:MULTISPECIES: SCO family protein [unclassified Photobacterium]|uniref:SCO family protein n=1 Tax=unclassified Photobacterium TaxID=2628852 RepID=UPI001EDFAEF6|nr:MULTISPECIES: SCO family protein [unclassified Photobacterium]MCG3865990.1 SCO family protein [Photobacterium sp. Ph6]MCG3877450.1 SCO family protein [Photobacterium sp. Ph5]
MKYQWMILAIALITGLTTSYILDSRDASRTVEPDYPLNILESGNEAVDLYNPKDPRIRMVYFGYTQCPDVCPTSLAVMSAALKQIPTEQLKNLWPIFITLDPERDTAIKTANYAKHFHSAISGMTGTHKQTKALADKYGVLYLRTDLKDSALEYAIDHNSYFYFLLPNGELIDKVPHLLNPAPLVSVIPDMIKSVPSAT